MANSIDITRGFEEHALASEISNKFTTGKAGKAEWERRVAEIIQYVYATSTKETSNSGNGWSHTTHIPKLTQIHDNLAANYASALFGGKDWFDFEAAVEDEATVRKAKGIKAYLRTKHDWNSFVKVMQRLLQDWVQTGNCFAKVEYVRETMRDEDDTEVLIYEGPRIIRISPYDVVIDHTATDFEHSPLIHRELYTRADFLRSVEENLDLDYDVAVVEKVIAFRTHLGQYKDSDINKNIQQQFDGFTTSSSYFQSGQIEVLEFIGDIYDEQNGKLLKNHLITVVDRRFVLRSKPLPTYDGRKQVYHAGWRHRPDNLWAMGPLDNLIGMQYLIDHLENARADAFDQMLSPDRVHVGQVQIEHDGPVTNYYIDDAQGNVHNLAPDATVLNADFQIERKEAQMEAYAGAPKEAMGMRSPGEKTKFEVQQLATAASRMFQTKIEDFERLVEDILNGELEIAYRNLNATDIAKTIDDDLGVVEFLEITKDDLKARGKLKARGASHFAKKAQLAQDLQGFAQAMQLDPSMAVHFPGEMRAKMWNEALDFNDGVFVPFGQIAEGMKQQELIQAAQGQLDGNQAATDVAEQV